VGWKRTHRARWKKRVLAGSGGAEQERPENVPHASEHSPAWQKCQRSATWHYEDIVFVAREPVTTSYVGGAAKGSAARRFSAQKQKEFYEGCFGPMGLADLPSPARCQFATSWPRDPF